MASQPDGWVWPGAPLFMRVIPAAGVCYRCGRAGGCNCAAQGSALPRLYTEAEVAARVEQARAKALEEAAAVAEREASDEWPIDDANRYAAAALRSAATAIRALKEKTT
jgi:hypothetical protein